MGLPILMANDCGMVLIFGEGAPNDRTYTQFAEKDWGSVE